ncbi:MAG: ParB/RepB/Spo0J family partition protein [Coxiellaceae bacterium]|nr:ParB/RepB/Spo0J family partition protein [Coxiellaceae bacterium]
MRRGLGKGLSDIGLGALLGDLQTAPTAVSELISLVEEKSESAAADGQLKKLSVDVLIPGQYQPRKIMAHEALEELANSIRTQGVIQPIVVRPSSNNQYEIIAGERRWRAARLAGLTMIPAIVREMNDETAVVLALIENIQRRDLNVMEEAFALNRLLTEFNMTHQQVADSVGKSRTNVTNILRLLKLAVDVRIMVESGQLEMGHARALLSLSDDEQSIAANAIVAQGLSVRETEEFIRTKQEDSQAVPVAGAKSDKIILHTLQDRLRQKLGVKVAITQNTKGCGKLVIRYKNERELEEILAHLH